MKSNLGQPCLKAFLVVSDTSQAALLVENLSRQGIEAIIQTQANQAIEEFKASPCDLVIVEENLKQISGIEFIQKLIKISWTTGIILISNEDKEVVHQKTEGLGILGHIRTLGDSDELSKLIKKYRQIING